MTASIKNKVCVCLCEAEWLCDLFSYLPSKCGSNTVQALNSGSHKHYSFPRKKQLKQQCRKRHSNRVMWDLVLRWEYSEGCVLNTDVQCCPFLIISNEYYYSVGILALWLYHLSPHSVYFSFSWCLLSIQRLYLKQAAIHFSTETLFSAKPVFPSLWILLFSPLCDQTLRAFTLQTLREPHPETFW